MLSKVIGCKRDHHGRPIGQAHDNPILDTRVYEIEFPDGHVAEYTTNEIAESLYAQIDEEGFDTGLISLIIQYLKMPFPFSMVMLVRENQRSLLLLPKDGN